MQSIEGISRGIYRINKINCINNGIIDSKSDIGDIADELNEVRGRDSLLNPTMSSPGYFPKRTFFPTVNEFLNTWMSGYDHGKSQFGENRIYNKLGFELFVHANQDKTGGFFSFADNGKLVYEEIHNKTLYPMMVCADLNGLYDIRGYLNLGVNDFRTQRVLVYRSRQSGLGTPIKYEELRNTEKLLRNNLKYYVWEGEEEFPFGSENPLKASGKMWFMIGISPLEVYDELEKLNFIFP